MKLMKPIFAMMTLGSLLVYAGVREDYQDFSFKTSKTVQGPKTFNELTQRDVASIEGEARTALPAIQYVALNNENRSLINSEWEVMRIVSEEGEEVFNAYQKESDRPIRVNFELLRTSVVQIDSEEGQVYYISLLTEANTLALFKEYNGGYEILEARRVSQVGARAASRSEMSDQVTQSISAGEMPASGPLLNAELVLEKALNPMKTADVLVGDAISGSATISGGSIERLSVTLHRGTTNEASFEMQFAEINDGGQFETQYGDEVVSGILTSSGNQGFRIRFATGPIQGAMLNFVTEEAFEEIQYEREQQEYERLEAQESPIVDEIREQQEEFQNQRTAAQPQMTNPGVEQNIYRPEMGDLEYQDEYQEEYQDEYQDEYQGEYQDEYAQEEVDEVNIAENGFEF